MSRQAVVEPKCNDCHEALTDDNWSEGARKKSVYLCRTCHRARVAAWDKAHPEQKRVRKAKSQKANRGTANASQKRWYEAHPEEHRARMADYRKRKEAEYVAKMGHGDPSRTYYTYCLYTLLPSGREYIFYYGKGKGSRVTDHEKIYRRKLKNPRSKLDAKEKFMLFCEDNGYPLLNRVIERGMTEDEAFNHEAELINAAGLQNLTNVAHPRRPRLIRQA